MRISRCEVAGLVGVCVMCLVGVLSTAHAAGDDKGVWRVNGIAQAEKTLTESSDASANAGLGLQYSNRKAEFYLSCAFLGNEDDVESAKIGEYGGNVLSPGNSSLSTSMGVSITPWLLPRGVRGSEDILFGGSLFLSAGGSDWVLPSAEGSEEEKAGVALWSACVGPSVRWNATPQDAKNELVLLFYAGPTWRAIGGDADESFRETALGTSETRFSGIETGLHVKVNRLYITAALPVLSDDDVDGLTGGQFLLGIALADGLKF